MQTRKSKQKAIDDLYWKAGIKSCIGYLFMSLATAMLWHKSYPVDSDGKGFYVLGFVVFGLFITSLYYIVTTILEVKNLRNCKDRFIDVFYQELVESGDIKPN